MNVPLMVNNAKQFEYVQHLITESQQSTDMIHRPVKSRRGIQNSCIYLFASQIWFTK